MSHRKPTASLIASVRRTPRTARLATASSQSTSVRTVDAANTTAYWRRNAAFVKSTCEVAFTASDSLVTIHAAASAQPLARDWRGSKGLLSERPPGVGGVPLDLSPFSQ